MSSQVIAFTKRVEFKTLLDIGCKDLTGFSPVVKDTVEDFRSILSLLPDINILILDESPSSKDYSFLVEALQEREGHIKNILLIGENILEIKNALSFSNDKIENLMDHLKKILNPGGEKASGHISVPADSLIHFKVLPFDLYIKLSEEKFIKRIPANEDIDESTVKSFKEKGITELYFEREYNRDFSLMLLNNMINKVEGEYTDVNAKLKARSEVFKTTKEIVQSVGLPARVIQVCESVMERISEDVAKDKEKLGEYLKQVKNQEHLSFQFRFIELTSFIATQMIDAQEEPTKEEDTKKIVFSAFFCDISLTEEEHLSYRSMDDIKDLWAEDQKVILNHPLKSSVIVQKYKNAPEGAETIIKEHHGSSSGVGFGQLSSSLHPLSKCLMASQEISLAILKNPQTSPKQLIAELITKFEGSAIHFYLQKFEKSCLSNL